LYDSCNGIRLHNSWGESNMCVIVAVVILSGLIVLCTCGISLAAEWSLSSLLEAIGAGDEIMVGTILEERPQLATKSDDRSHMPIHYAALHNRPEIVRLLLGLGANPLGGIYPFREITSPLEICRMRGYAEGEAVMLEWLEEAHGTTQGGIALSRLIIADRFSDAISVLADDSGALEGADEWGKTPLMVAGQFGRLDIGRVLVKRGANVSSVDLGGRTPLMFCLKRRSWDERIDEAIELARLLVREGADYGLWAAAALGDGDRVTELLRGCQDCFPASTGFERDYVNPLPIAAFFGHADIVALLLDACDNMDVRFDMDVRDGVVTQFGLPLRYATEMGHFDVVKLLVERGANPNTYQYAAGSAVSWANQAPGRKHIADYLFLKGARADLISYLLADNRAAISERLRFDPPATRSFLGDAVLAGHFAYVEAALSALSENSEFDDSFWWSMGRQAIRCWRSGNPAIEDGGHDHEDYARILDLLINKSGIATMRGEIFGATMLHWAVAVDPKRPVGAKAALVDVLLSEGADLESRDREFQATPLGWAAMVGDLDVVMYLTKKGAKVGDSTDSTWSSPIALAKNRGHDTVVDFLDGILLDR
jgi:ankyrin repeat protein